MIYDKAQMWAPPSFRVSQLHIYQNHKPLLTSTPTGGTGSNRVPLIRRMSVTFACSRDVHFNLLSPAPAINNSSQSINVTKSKQRNPSTVWKVRTRHLVKRSAVYPVENGWVDQWWQRTLGVFWSSADSVVLQHWRMVSLFSSLVSLLDCLVLKKIFTSYYAANKMHLFKKQSQSFYTLWRIFSLPAMLLLVSFLLMTWIITHCTFAPRINCSKIDWGNVIHSSAIKSCCRDYNTFECRVRKQKVSHPLTLPAQLWLSQGPKSGNVAGVEFSLTCSAPETLVPFLRHRTLELCNRSFKGKRW